MSHVICPETIVGPHPPLGFLAAFPELKPNQPCGLRCEVHRLAPEMEFRCARGHQFIATEQEVIHEPTPN